MKKRGLGNIEFILAFIMFIGFVITALYLFNPTKNLQVMDTSKYYVYNEIIKNTTIKVDSYSIRINSFVKDSKGQNVPVGPVVAINLPGVATGKYPRAENYAGKVLDAKWDEPLHIATVASGDDHFVILKFGEEFVNSIVASATLDRSAYALASSTLNNSMISEKKMLLLNESYYQDYNNLKTKLGIPSKTDFGFSLRFSDSAIVADRTALGATEVFSEGDRIEVLRKDGTSAFADFTIKIW